MGKRGTKPLPTELKVARGTYRRDRSGDVLAVPVSHVPSAPESLGDFGRTEWQKKAPDLQALGILSSLDLSALETYCRTFDEVSKCDAELEKDGDYYTTDKGFIGQHPAVNQRFKWLDLRRRYEAEFGLTASSRSSLKVSGTKKSVVSKRQRA